MAVEKKETLKEIPWEKTGLRMSAPSRTVKMIMPVCPESQSEDGSSQSGCETSVGGAWWVECEKRGHDPYHQAKPVSHRTPVVREQEDGRQLIVGYDEEIELVRSPRVIQVPAGVRSNSGWWPDNKRFFHGYKFPHELGYKDMCEFRNCYDPNVRFKTKAGNYCNEEQAKMMAADLRHINLEVYNAEKRADQIDAINVQQL